LENYRSILQEIEDSILAQDFGSAIQQSETLRELALSGLHYFQTYDWHMLMFVITLGYVGWMVNLIIHVVKTYTSFPRDLIAKKSDAKVVTSSSDTVSISHLVLTSLLGIGGNEALTPTHHHSPRGISILYSNYYATYVKQGLILGIYGL
jgi:GPI ethanolamine phosphate transferase 1